MPPVSSRPAKGRPRPRRRGGLVALLLIAASVAAFAGSYAIWLNRQALSADGWARTSPHLIANAPIRTAIGAFAVQELFRLTHAETALRSVLPQPQVGPTSRRLRALGRRLAAGILRSRSSRGVWQTANRQANRQLRAILNHHSRATVSLDLDPLFQRLVRALEASSQVRALPGADRLFAIAPGAGRLPVLPAGDVNRARATVNAVRGLSIILTIAAIALFAAAVAAAGGWRPGAVACVGWCVAVVGGLILLSRALVAPALADALVPASSPSTVRPAARAAWLISTSDLRSTAVATVIAGGVLVIAGLAARAVVGRRGTAGRRA
jgi:hypothetical protein